MINELTIFKMERSPTPQTNNAGNSYGSPAGDSFGFAQFGTPNSFGTARDDLGGLAAAAAGDFNNFESYKRAYGYDTKMDPKRRAYEGSDGKPAAKPDFMNEGGNIHEGGSNNNNNEKEAERKEDEKEEEFNERWMNLFQAEIKLHEKKMAMFAARNIIAFCQRNHLDPGRILYEVSMMLLFFIRQK